MTHVAESTHWYAKDGAPAYQIPYADPRKGMRNVTLRDARKLDLWPGFSTISKVLAAPGLERWKQNQVLLAALTLPAIKGETSNEFEARIWADSREHGRAAAERGVAIHAAVQDYFEIINKPVFVDLDLSKEYLDLCVAAYAEVLNHFGPNKWKCEQSFFHPLGFGGKCDVHADGIIGDFKTKEFDKDNLPKPYPEQIMQLAAYRNGLEMPQATCFNLFISVNNPGLVHLHIFKEEEIEQEWTVFKHALAIWQSRNKHHP